MIAHRRSHVGVGVSPAVRPKSCSGSTPPSASTAAVAPGHRRQPRPCRHAGASGPSCVKPMARRSGLGLDQIEKRDRPMDASPSRPSSRISTPTSSPRLRELDRRVRPGGPYRPLAQRSRWRWIFPPWLRDAIDGLDAQLVDPHEASSTGPREHAATDHAGLHPPSGGPSPSTFGHHLLADVEMVATRPRRLADCAGASTKPARRGRAGRHRFPIDRRPRPPRSARAAHANSMDAVSARDFAIEFLACGAPSRHPPLALRRELVLGPAKAFPLRGLGRCLHHPALDHAPERNPNAAELVRARRDRPSGRWCSCSWC